MTFESTIRSMWTVQVFLLPESTIALSFSLCAARLAPAQAALFVPRADYSARFSAFAFA